jgi:hypothetical protein
VTLNSETRYYWHVRGRNAGGWGPYSATWSFTTQPVVSVPERGGAPAEFALSQNYPNPFNPTTRITIAIPHAVFVTLEVYNLLGERVAVLVNGEREAGYYAEQFNAEGLASGMYFYKLQAGDFVQTRKLILLR